MEKFGKDFLIKEIASRAEFTQGDVRIILNTFEDIVKEAVRDHDDLMIGGLFKVYCHEILPHDGFDINTKEKTHRDTTYRLSIRPSTTLRKILKDSVVPQEKEE